MPPGNHSRRCWVREFATNLAPTYSHTPSRNPKPSRSTYKAFVFPQECKRPIRLKLWLTWEKLQATLWHSSSADPSICRLNSWQGAPQQWWRLTFLSLSSNNMAFKMLLTLHNSSIVPFTWASEAVHPHSDPRDSRRADRMDGNVTGRLPLTGGLLCDRTLHTSTFPYSSVSSTSSWQLNTH